MTRPLSVRLRTKIIIENSASKRQIGKTGHRLQDYKLILDLICSREEVLDWIGVAWLRDN